MAAGVIFVSTSFLQAQSLSPAPAQKIGELQILTAKAIRLYRAGNAKAALGLLETVAGRAKLAFGARHPVYTRSLNNLALLQDETGSLEQAEQTYRRAIAIVEAQLPPRLALLADLQNNLAAMILQQCRISDAQMLYQRARDIRKGNSQAVRPLAVR